VPAVNHHYLPRTYLRRFTFRRPPDLLWEYDKSTGLAAPSTPKKCGCEAYYHAFEKEDGTLDTDSIETDLSRIETQMAGVYETLRHQRPLSPSEWTAFYTFAGVMLVRVPGFVANIQNFASKVLSRSFEIMKTTESFQKRSEELGIPREKLLGMKATARRDFALLMSLRAMRTPIEAFSEMGWKFLVAPPDHYFITGDNPVFYLAPGQPQRGFYRAGLAHQDIEVTFPLSRKVCALGAWKTADAVYENANPRLVNIANIRTAMAAHRYLYAPENNYNFFVPKPADAA